MSLKHSLEVCAVWVRSIEMTPFVWRQTKEFAGQNDIIFFRRELFCNTYGALINDIDIRNIHDIVNEYIRTRGS